MAGDIITIELDPDVFKMMQEAVGSWSDEMAQVRCRMRHSTFV